MRVSHLLLLSISACGARTEIWGAAEAREEENPVKSCNQGDIFSNESPPCEGFGLIMTVDDQCIDDGGSAAGDDLLEVYCVDAVARFCLSNEQCPWRSGVPTSDARTCSPSGLKSDYMANTRSGCAGFQNHEYYCCSADGQISFADH